MAKPTNIAVVHQTLGGAKHVYQTINLLLARDGLERVRVAVAYASWAGLGLIAERLEAFLTGGGEFQSIYGVGNGVTTPDAMLYSLYLKKLYPKHSYAGVVEEKYSNATFHPKFYEFKFATGIIAIVGSANLTGGGLLRNTELGLRADVPAGTGLVAELDKSWSSLVKESKKTTLGSIRALKKNAELGSEIKPSPSGAKAKPFLKVSAKLKPKPLFAKVLNLQQVAKKEALLSGLDPLTEKPKRLYLQVFKYETGGVNGKPGYQIQLPKATLASFFGVGPTSQPLATFKFGKVIIQNHFTHFNNNTHRLRLMPLRDVPRPTVVTFDRIGPNIYKCGVVKPKRYSQVLAKKCTEQTRNGARKWGLE